MVFQANNVKRYCTLHTTKEKYCEHTTFFPLDERNGLKLL